jgi:hypothetical protein
MSQTAKSVRGENKPFTDFSIRKHDTQTSTIYGHGKHHQPSEEPSDWRN